MSDRNTQLFVRRLLLGVTAFMLSLSAGGAAQASQPITEAEREKAIRYLTETKENVESAVRGLSDAQLKFKAGPDRWSIAEVVEHLAIAEELMTNTVLPGLPNAPAPAADRNAKQIDDLILAKVPDRTEKFKAPEAIVPTGRWSPEQALQHFSTSRKQTIEAVKSTSGLRDHVAPHPALGPLDGYQWALGDAAHTERHTKQILEVKADPNFPAK